jgi:hypothetical protein
MVSCVSQAILLFGGIIALVICNQLMKNNDFVIIKGIFDGQYYIENYIINKPINQINIKKILKNHDNYINNHLHINNETTIFDQINIKNNTIGINYYKATLRILYDANYNKFCIFEIENELNYENIMKKINKLKNETYFIIYNNNYNKCHYYSKKLRKNLNKLKKIESI